MNRAVFQHVLRALAATVLAVVFSAEPAAAAIMDGLIGHWTFDDPANPYADSSPLANNGVKEGTGTLVPVAGQVGAGALQFDGAARVNVGSNSAFDTETYTVSAWAYKDPGAGGSWRVVAGAWDAGWMHLGQHSTGKFSNHVRVDGVQKDMIGTSAVKTQEWQHIVSVVDKANKRLQLWVDGVQEVNTTVSTWGSTNVPGTTDVRIGTPYAAGTYTWIGRLDDVGMWNRALSADEIKAVRLLGSAHRNFDTPLAPHSGLVSYYQFEGNGQDTARDYSQSSGTSVDNLTPVGSIGYAAGVMGQAADLSGGYFTAPISPDVQLPTTFSIEAWINPHALGEWRRLVLNWGAQQSYHFALHNGQVSLFIRETDGNVFEVAAGGSVVTNQWQHIAGVLDSATLTGSVYLNGALVGTGSFDGTLFTATTEGLGIGDSVGGPSSGYRFDGLVDALALWNVALTPEQIASHYLAGAAGYGVSLPEPASLAIFALGGIALAAFGRRRRPT